jgi:Ankyrin repeat
MPLAAARHSTAEADAALSRPPSRRLPGAWHHGPTMSEQETGKQIPDDDQVAVELRLAVHAGDVEAVQRLLRSHPALATARLGSKETGTATPLHLVTDWPGYFPNGPQIVRLLIDAGADPNALTTSRGAEATGTGDETPLHYAASSDDAEVMRGTADGSGGGGSLPNWRGSPESPEDSQVRSGDAVDAQQDQLVETLAVVDRPRQDQQLVLMQPGDQARVYQALEN